MVVALYTLYNFPAKGIQLIHLRVSFSFTPYPTFQQKISENPYKKIQPLHQKANDKTKTKSQNNQGKDYNAPIRHNTNG